MFKKDLSIIIVSYNTEKITIDCLDSIYKSKTSFNYEIIVIDNNSSDNSAQSIKNNYPEIRLIESLENQGFSKANNLGIQRAKGKYILLLNSDTILFDYSLENLLKEAILKDYDIAGPVLLNTDRTVQRSWFNFPSALKIFLRLTKMYTIFYRVKDSFILKMLYAKKKPAFMLKDFSEDTPMDYLSFACILIKKEVFQNIGELDSELFFYQEDCEFGLRAKKNNYKIVYCIFSQIIHLGGASSSQVSWFAFENDIKGLLHVYKKHYPNGSFKMVRLLIYISLQLRIIFTRFGFYKDITGKGLYSKEQQENKYGKQIVDKYKELKNLVKNY